MNYRVAAIFCICLSLLITSCKKEEQEEELFPVELSGNNLIFSNTTSDTVILEFALIRIAEARLLNGRLNDGFVLDSGTLPVVMIPYMRDTLEKQRFVFKTDTLRNEDQLKSIAYNIRYIAEGDTVAKAKTFSKDF